MESGYGRGTVKFIRVLGLYLRLDRMVALEPAANNQTKLSRISINGLYVRMSPQKRVKSENQPLSNLRMSYSFYGKIENEPPRCFIKFEMSSCLYFSKFKLIFRHVNIWFILMYPIGLILLATACM